MVEQLLLLLKIGFVVLLYLFIWRVIRVGLTRYAGRAGERDPHPGPAGEARRPAAGGRAGRDPQPRAGEGSRIPIAHELVAGRESALDITLQADGYASSRHCRFIRGRDADVIEDLHSTNGTFVNGQRLNGSRTLAQGDTITLGQTQFTYERGA